MQVNISGHQLEVTKPLREYTESKLNKLAGHFDKITNESAPDARYRSLTLPP
jgi:putative sigma-54 modulation protein